MRSSLRRELLVDLERLDPYRGPCGLCGGPDGRHRIWDMMLGRFRAGAAIEAIANDYRVPARVLMLVLRLSLPASVPASVLRRERNVAGFTAPQAPTRDCRRRQNL